MTQMAIAPAHDTPLRINDLPYDVLAHIFEVLFFDSHHPDRHHWQSRCRCFLSTLAISQVCRTWRQISISKPLLWTHVFYPYMPYSNSFFIEHEEAANKIPLFLRRSGSLPLTVQLCFCWHDDLILPEGDNILSSLLENANRWHSLVIWAWKCFDETHSNMFLSSLKDLRSLSHLEIIECHWAGESFTSTLELPSLVSLRLMGVQSSIELPWNQIRDLVTDSETVSFKVLEHSSVISSVDLGMAIPPRLPNEPSPSSLIQVADTLKQLIVNPRVSRTLCDPIAELPGLKRIAQEVCYPGSTADYSRFIQRRLCHIISKAPLLEELHLRFSWSYSLRPPSEGASIDFSTSLHSTTVRVFHLTFILRGEDDTVGFKKANGLLDRVFGLSNNDNMHNRSVTEGAASTISFPFPNISEFSVVLRIDPRTSIDDDDSDDFRQRYDRQRGGAEALTDRLLRILSVPKPQNLSNTPQRTFRLEYDAPLHDYLEAQRASLGYLQSGDKWDTVFMGRVQPHTRLFAAYPEDMMSGCSTCPDG